MLVVSEARKRFGDVVAIAGIDLTISDGSTFGLLGPNGAGKTTMMRMILGIVTPDSGTIAWNGASIDEHVRQRFGYLPEERGLYGRLRVRDHIIYFGRLHGMSKRDAERGTDAWIERLDIGQYAQRPCSELSKGNQQKVQIACAVVHGPALLVLDEPFSGLDPVNAGILQDLLAELQRAGATLVLSSHEMWHLERFGTEFCIIANGAVRARGSLAELRSAWPTRRIRVAPNTGIVRSTLAAVAGANVVEGSDERITVDLPRSTDCAALLRLLVDAEAIASFEQIEPSLNDLYLRALAQKSTH
jgi:ABC-2 type transport system ATP-binding protein